MQTQFSPESYGTTHPPTTVLAPLSATLNDPPHAARTLVRDTPIKNNRFTFRRSQVQTDINLSDGTAPETFRFESNHWLAEDRPDRSQPKLPTQEIAGTYGVPHQSR